MYSGSAVALVVGGAAEHGEMLYALGKDNVNAPDDAYDKAIPTARDIGTYYVWYMAKGDEMHAPSEAVCIEVKITGSLDEPENPEDPKDPDPKEQDDPVEPAEPVSPGSPSGGCNAGFSFMGFGILLSALIMRRRS